MKKLLLFALATIMLFSVTACSAANGNDPSSPTILQNPPTVSNPTVPTPPPSEPTEPTMSENVVSMMVDGVTYPPICLRYPMENGFIRFAFGVDQSLFPNAEITLDITRDRGYLAGNWGVFQEKNFTVANNYDCDWRLSNDDNYSIFRDGINPIYVDAVIRADGNIVGYCLVEIGREEYYYTITRTEMMIFPMVDGQIQYISEEYIADLIAQSRAIVTPFDLEEKRAEAEAWWREQVSKD